MQRGENYGALASLTQRLRSSTRTYVPTEANGSRIRYLDIPDDCKTERASAWTHAGLDESILEDLLSESGPMPLHRG